MSLAMTNAEKVNQYLVMKISKIYLTEVISSGTQVTKKISKKGAKKPPEKLRNKAAKFSKSWTAKSVPWEVLAGQFFD